MYFKVCSTFSLKMLYEKVQIKCSLPFIAAADWIHRIVLARSGMVSMHDDLVQGLIVHILKFLCRRRQSHNVRGSQH